MGGEQAGGKLLIRSITTVTTYLSLPTSNGRLLWHSIGRYGNSESAEGKGTVTVSFFD